MYDESETRGADAASTPDDGRGRAKTPETLILKPEGDGKPGKIYRTLMLSASSKAQACILTCDRCNSDNVSEANFCEQCGANLAEQEQQKASQEAEKQIEKYRDKLVKPKAEGRTIFRRRRPLVKDDGIERKSFHSQYIPSGLVEQQYDQSAFQSSSQPAAAAAGGYHMNAAVAAPSQGVADRKTGSFIAGVAVLSVLSVLFMGLLTTIVILLLK